MLFSLLFICIRILELYPTVQRGQNLLAHPAFLHDQIDHAPDHVPPHAAGASLPHPGTVAILVLVGALHGADDGGEAATGWLNHADREQFHARAGLRRRFRSWAGDKGGRSGEGEAQDDVGDGKFLTRRVEEDVGADGDSEHGGGRAVRGRGRVQRFRGSPVIVEERVFVVGEGRDGRRQAGVEQGEVTG